MEKLYSVLSNLGEFSYVRSYGNLGDLLIAEGTEQYFLRNRFKYNYLSPFCHLNEEHNLVHGGGARFTKDWCDMETCIKLLCNKHVKKCVILPSSFHDVDELLEHFDKRHILFCRDAASYEYCLRHCPHSQVYLENDMAFHLLLDELKPAALSESTENEEEEKLKKALNYLPRWMKRNMSRATVSSSMNRKKQKFAFLLRTDKEKKTDLSSPLAYDISLCWHTPPKNKFNANLLLAFSDTLRQADIIVSDRLHVCIMAYLSGREVYMIDNTYGKLKGVYDQTLQQNKRVHLTQPDTLPEDLRIAWNKLNNPLRIFFYKSFDKAKLIIKRILKK